MLTNRLIKEMNEFDSSPVVNISAGPINKDNMLNWIATIIGPSGTPYEGGAFSLDIKFTEKYPFIPPIIHFTTPIYHCNINSYGSICLDILKQNWSPALTISKVLISICSLLAEPNPKDPLVSSIAELYISNKSLHDYYAKEFTIKHAN